MSVVLETFRRGILNAFQCDYKAPRRAKYQSEPSSENSFPEKSYCSSIELTNCLLNPTLVQLPDMSECLIQNSSYNKHPEKNSLTEFNSSLHRVQVLLLATLSSLFIGSYYYYTSVLLNFLCLLNKFYFCYRWSFSIY